MKKVLVCIFCFVGLIGFLGYEGYSIVQKEYETQREVVKETRAQVNFNLDMVKIAIMTEDTEAYARYLGSIRENSAVISAQSLARDEGYLGKLGEYISVLESKAGLLTETRDARSEILKAKNSLSENYNELTKEKLKEAQEKIAGLKIDASRFSEEKVVAAISKVNEILDVVSEKAAALSGCVDTCYKNRISTLNDELAEKLKGFSEVTDGVNREIEWEFEFSKMEEIKGV